MSGYGLPPPPAYANCTPDNLIEELVILIRVHAAHANLYYCYMELVFSVFMIAGYVSRVVGEKVRVAVTMNYFGFMFPVFWDALFGERYFIVGYGAEQL